MGNRSILQKLGVALGVLSNPWTLLLDKAGLVKKPLYVTRATSKRSSVKFNTRGKTTDINDAVVVLSGKEYPPELLGLDNLARRVQPQILDCGGHIGSFTMYVKSICPQAKILAMEPVPDNQQLFLANVQRNQLTDINLLPYALYGTAGTFYIDLANKQFDAVHVTSDQPNHNQFIIINALTLDAVMRQNNLTVIDLMKLDVEGAEYHIFQHSLDALGKYVRRIIMEFHPAGDKQKRDEIVNRLCGQGTFKLVFETKNILGFDNENFTS